MTGIDFDTLADRWAEIKDYRSDPVGWIKERLGAHLWSAQREVIELVRDNRYVAVPSCHDVGKLLHPDTPLPTPDGWAKAGQVEAGQELFDERGSVCRVTGVTETWDRPEYRVSFDDGSSILTGPEHEWAVHDLASRIRGVADWRGHSDRLVVVETRAMARELRTPAGQLRWRVPVAWALELPDADLPVDPYLLGVWLGDGTEANGTLTFGHDKLAILEHLGEHRVKPCLDEDAYRITLPGFRRQLIDAGLLGNKHIPAIYFRASESQRRALLAGLMDTDGFVMTTGKGAVGIDLCNRGLAEGLYELVVSLGSKVRWAGHPAVFHRPDGVKQVTGVRYRMNWRPLQNPFRVRGQSWIDSPSQRSRHTVRTITSVELTGRRVVNYCVSVDSSSRLYLAGEQMVPTHNSYLAAAVASWWLDVHPVGEAFVVSTAPTDAQVKAILWREIGRMHDKGHLRGKVNKQAQWFMGAGEKELVGYGRKPADHVNVEQAMQSFQGIHARYVLVVIDEGCGVPKWLFDAADALATNDNARILVIGNPDDPGSHFAKVCKPGSGWAVRPISAFDSPNFTDEEVPDYLRELLIGRTWVEERRKRWGVQNPMYQSKVLGRFPEVGDHNLIQPAWVLAAQNRSLPPDTSDQVMGVDVARFGSDETVAYLRQGSYARRVMQGHGWATTKTAGVVIREVNGHEHPTKIQIDDVGIGGGVYDMLVEGGLRPLGMNGGARAQEMLKSGKPKFVNARAEWWWHLRELLESGDLDLDALDEELAAQLVDIRWGVNSHGQIWVETKDEMKGRGVDSPDRGDALAYACARAVSGAPVKRTTIKDRRLSGRR